MNLRFPLKDVKIEITGIKHTVNSPAFNDGYYVLNQTEFSMNVDGVACFYAAGGNFVSIVPAPSADKNAIELYLNGSVYGAILHQRRILPLHGSSFVYHNKGILICGDTGAGKSSVTAAFCLDGAEFLTDDVTPILFKDDKPQIWALSDRIKLWQDTLNQLDRDHSGLDKIDQETDKFYYPIISYQGIMTKFDRIYIIEPDGDHVTKIFEITGASKFMSLRREIYRYEYLQGMSENEIVYFRNLADISNNCPIFRITRPVSFKVREIKKVIENHLLHF